jgi:hypothetical protein
MFAMIIKPPCDRCGQPFVNGSSSTCQNCLQDTRADGHRRRHRLKCDCGLPAAEVIYVKISIGEAVSLEPLAVCEQCLQIEMETQKEYL